MPRTRAQGREAKDGTGGNGGGAKELEKPLKNFRRDVENGEDLGNRRQKHRLERVGSVGADRGFLEDIHRIV